MDGVGGGRGPGGDGGGVGEVGEEGVDEGDGDAVAVLVGGDAVEEEACAGARHGDAVEGGGGEQGGGEAADDDGGPDPLVEDFGQDRGVQDGEFRAEGGGLPLQQLGPVGGRRGVRLEDDIPVPECDGAAQYGHVQLFLRLGADDVQRRQVLAEQQGRALGQAVQAGGVLVLEGGGQFGQDLGEGLGGYDLGLDPVFREQQRAQPGDEVQVEQPADPGRDEGFQLVAGRAVRHEAVGVDLDGRRGEDIDQRERGLDLDGLDDQLQVVVAQAPQEPQSSLPQGDVLDAGLPAARVERGDGLVPGQDLVEAAAQGLEAGHRVQGGGGLGDAGVVADQEQPAVRGGELPRVQGGGQGGGAVEGGRHEDLRTGGHGHHALTSRRRRRRSRTLRSTSMASRASVSTSWGIFFIAAALITLSLRATAGS